METPERTIFTLQNTCRSCMKYEKAEDLHSIFCESKINGIQSATTTIHPIQLFKDCQISNIPQETDDLPKKICCGCIKRLIDFAEFRGMFERSQITLEQIFTGAHVLEIEHLDEYNVKDEEFKEIEEDIQILRTPEDKDHGEQLIFADGFSEVSDVFTSEDEIVVKPTSTIKRRNGLFCTVCYKKFRTKKSLDSHRIKKRHQGSKKNDPFLCNRCGKLFDTTAELTHHKSLDCRLLDCRNCKVNFESIEELDKHLNDLHPLIDRLIFCTLPDCNKSFGTREKYKTHLLSHNRRNDCGECDQSFPTRVELLRHRQVKHPVAEDRSCPKCGKKFKTTFALRKHIIMHDPSKKLKCQFCEKSFTTKLRLVYHEKGIHKGIRPHVCSICGKAFSEWRYLNDHEKIHREERSYVCDICGANYKQPSSLAGHIREKHTDKTNLLVQTCPICSNEYKTKQQLKLHMRNHTNIRNHACTQCDKTYKTQAHLKLHIDTVHLKITYPCEICGKLFTSPGNRKAHGRDVHKINNLDRIFVCSYCGRDYVLEVKLKEHIRKHHGNKVKEIATDG